MNAGTNVVETNEMEALQALLALTGEDYVNLVTFSDTPDALELLEAVA